MEKKDIILDIQNGKIGVDSLIVSEERVLASNLLELLKEMELQEMQDGEVGE